MPHTSQLLLQMLSCRATATNLLEVTKQKNAHELHNYSNTKLATNVRTSYKVKAIDPYLNVLELIQHLLFLF